MSWGNVDACPECDSAAIRTRNHGHPHSPDHSTSKYNCKRCGASFDDPTQRDRYHPGGINQDTGAKALLDADPDDVLGGESI